MRVATLNVRHRLPVAKFRADVTRVLKESPDFLGLQESSGKDRRQALIALTAGGAWLVVNDAPHQTPIVVDAEKKRVLDHGTEKLTDRLKPDATTGAGTATKKHAAWVLVEDRTTKRREAYVNCHLVPSLWFPPRSRLHKRQVAALAELVRDLFKRADDVYVVGDFNAPLKRLGPLRKAGLRHATTVASHGRRSIDHILSNRPLEAQRTLDGLHTDHRAVVADFKTKGKPPVPEPTYPPPAPVYLGPAAHTSSGNNKPVRRIVVHSTVSPCEEGGARNIAAYFRSEKAGGSAHYVIDPGEVVQVVYDSVIAWHAPPNPYSLGLEMCDIPGPVPGDKPGSARWKAAKRVWRWRRPEQLRMLRRTARLTAELCLAYDVPAKFLPPRLVRVQAKGITTHNHVSRAFGQSTHWDPGFWPRRRFMRMVRREIRAIEKEAK